MDLFSHAHEQRVKSEATLAAPQTVNSFVLPDGQIAKAQLTESLTGVAIIAACNLNGCVAAWQMAANIGQLLGMKCSRADETEAIGWVSAS